MKKACIDATLLISETNLKVMVTICNLHLFVPIPHSMCPQLNMCLYWWAYLNFVSADMNL